MQGKNDQIKGDIEISVFESINFLQCAWKNLVIASLVGAVLGFASWSLFSSYSAEYVLQNANTNIDQNINFISWKALQKSLPRIAAQVVENNITPDNQASLYKAMADEVWWQKNVVPNYALTKVDAKDLFNISKDLDTDSTTILSLTLTASGSTKEQSIYNVRAASKFLITGSAYLKLCSLLNDYDIETISKISDLQQKITSTKIELGYQQERAKFLEELHKRFPGGANVFGQVVDPKDSGAKYLPLATQIIAVNNDINSSKEKLDRLQKSIEQVAIIKIFLDQALPLKDATLDGLALNNELLAIEASLRSKLTKSDINSQQVLDRLRAQLLRNQTYFAKGLETNTAPISKKKGIFKSTIGGLATGFFMMLMILLVRRMYKKTVESSGR